MTNMFRELFDGIDEDIETLGRLTKKLEKAQAKIKKMHFFAVIFVSLNFGLFYLLAVNFLFKTS